MKGTEVLEASMKSRRRGLYWSCYGEVGRPISMVARHSL